MRQAAEAAIPLRLGELPELILRDRDIYVVIRRAGGAARCAAPRLETSRSEERLHRRVPVDEGRRWRRRHRENGCWCSRNKRRPYVSLIWCSTPSGHGNGLRPWIRNNGRRTAYEPLNLTLDLEYAHVSGHPRNPVSNRRAGCTIWSTFQAALFLWDRGA
jgi:hypothetical protein